MKSGNKKKREKNKIISIQKKEGTKYEKFEVIKNLQWTEHAMRDRKKRIEMCFTESVNTKIDSVFVADLDHDNGREFHIVLENAIMYIVNVDSGKLVNAFYAREGQLRIRYKMSGLVCPIDIVEKAKENERKGLNLI